MNALSALATAIIARPARAAPPPTLEAALRYACSGAWRAVEIVLAGDLLRTRLGKTSDRRVKAGVEAVLALFGATSPVRAEALHALRAARDAGVLDGDLDVTAVAQRCAPAGAPISDAYHIEALQNALGREPALQHELGDPVLAALLLDTARTLFHHTARRDGSLAHWAIPQAADPAREKASNELAGLLGWPASVEELDKLIALPLALDENVQFTVYRPRSIDPGRWHPLLAFAHLAENRPDETLPDPVEEVRRQAEAALGERAAAYQAVTQDSRAAIPREGELVFVPEVEGIEFNPPSRSFLWLEPVHREEFRMRAGPELLGTTARGRLTVFLGHIAIAEVALSVRVDAAPRAGAVPPPPEPTRARTYRRIFASYSHRDVAIVNQFEQYARALGDEYVRDWVHLRTGEVWNDRLRQLIEQADAFQLFWSWNAMTSPFVRQEYEHALSLNRPNFVRPTYWEDPMPKAQGLPPESLLRLHFQRIGTAVPAQRPSRPRPPSFNETSSMAPEDPTLDESPLDEERTPFASDATIPAEGNGAMNIGDLINDALAQPTPPGLPPKPGANPVRNAPPRLTARNSPAVRAASVTPPRPAEAAPLPKLDLDLAPTPVAMQPFAREPAKPTTPAKSAPAPARPSPAPAPRPSPAPVARPSPAPRPSSAPPARPNAGPMRPGGTMPAPTEAARKRDAPPEPGINVCPRCNKENQSHYKFCLGCGADLQHLPTAKPIAAAQMKTMMVEPAPAQAQPMAPAPLPPPPPAPGMGMGARPMTGAPPMGGPPMPAPQPMQPMQPAVGRAPTGNPIATPPRMPGAPMTPPPMGPPPGVPFSPAFSSAFAPPQPRICPSCGSEVPASLRFCGTCGFRMDEGSAPVAMPPQLTAGMNAPAAAPAPQLARLSMTLIRPDGSEGATHDLRPGDNKVGRNFGPVFQTDFYLSPVHAQILIHPGGTATIRDLDSANGIFVRMTQEEELVPGQVFRVGQEMLRFEAVTPYEPDGSGTELSVSPNPGWWAKLVVLLGDGITGGAYPLLATTVTLGRSRGDINFVDDGYVSGLHARLELRDGRVFLIDLGSSNGTFIKINGERTVAHGTLVLLGEQLFRLNLVG